MKHRLHSRKCSNGTVQTFQEYDNDKGSVWVALNTVVTHFKTLKYPVPTLVRVLNKLEEMYALCGASVAE